jgi:hypothetical protein
VLWNVQSEQCTNLHTLSWGYWSHDHAYQAVNVLIRLSICDRHIISLQRSHSLIEWTHQLMISGKLFKVILPGKSLKNDLSLLRESITLIIFRKIPFRSRSQWGVSHRANRRVFIECMWRAWETIHTS